MCFHFEILNSLCRDAPAVCSYDDWKPQFSQILMLKERLELFVLTLSDVAETSHSENGQAVSLLFQLSGKVKALWNLFVIWNKSDYQTMRSGLSTVLNCLTLLWLAVTRRDFQLIPYIIPPNEHHVLTLHYCLSMYTCIYSHKPLLEPVCLQSCLNSLWHRFNKMLKHENIRQLLQICQLNPWWSSIGLRWKDCWGQWSSVNSSSCSRQQFKMI